MPSSWLLDHVHKIRQRTLDLPFFLLKHITSLKDHPGHAPGESLPYWFQGNFAAMFVLNYLVERISFV